MKELPTEDGAEDETIKIVNDWNWVRESMKWKKFLRITISLHATLDDLWNNTVFAQTGTVEQTAKRLVQFSEFRKHICSCIFTRCQIQALLVSTQRHDLQVSPRFFFFFGDLPL